MTLHYLHYTDFHAINGYKKVHVSTIIHIEQWPFKHYQYFIINDQLPALDLGQNNTWIQFNSKTYLTTHFNKYLQHNISITTLTCISRYQLNRISLYFNKWLDLPWIGYAFPRLSTLPVGKQQSTLVCRPYKSN